MQCRELNCRKEAAGNSNYCKTHAPGGGTRHEVDPGVPRDAYDPGINKRDEMRTFGFDDGL
jgi:hypothetical protein